MDKFTDEELQAARSVDLVDFASHMNIPLKRKGRYYYVDGMDSLVIFNRSTWYRYSRGIGGSTIDFVMYFENLTFREAVARLLEFAGYNREGSIMKPPDGIKVNKESLKDRLLQDIREPFILPEKAPDCRGLYAYLMKRRMLSKEVVRYWLGKEMMYESLPYHNIVFLGRDRNGAVRFASQRGIRDDCGKPFKGDVPGNDKQYGVNIISRQSEEVNVYEAAIDAMSDMDFRNDYKTSILALGMVADGPLKKVLEEYPHIRKINFCLDNDQPGRAAARKLAEKYRQAGYGTEIRFPPHGKDFNEYLQRERKNQDLYRQPQERKGRDLCMQQQERKGRDSCKQPQVQKAR